MTGKTALITGSTQGLGLAMAERLAQAGCNLVLNGLADPAAAGAIERRLTDRFGVRTCYSDADLRSPAEIERMIRTAATTFEGVDILVNNAVVRKAAPVEEFPPADWDEALAVNLSAAFHTIRLVLPMMRRSGWGRIINVSSVYGLRGAVNRVGYVTTKTGLIGLTRAVALETAGQNITCNAICPGTTRTPVHEQTLSAVMHAEGVSFDEAQRRILEGKQPTGRLISPDDVAAFALFLCGPEGGHITGAALPIDGAWSAG